MKIYSYYNDINFDHQQEILSLWEESWKSKGFVTKILGIDDTKKHPYYQEFIKQLQIIYKKISGTDPNQYELNCYLRWLAYASINEDEAFLISDYDVINKNFTIDDTENIQKLNELSFLDSHVPCFAYGNSKQFLDFCVNIIEYSHKHKEDIIENYKKQSCPGYRDQEFLLLNRHRLNNYNFLDNYVNLYNYGRPHTNSKLLHVAHCSAGKAITRFNLNKKLDKEQLRISFIKDIINNQIQHIPIKIYTYYHNIQFNNQQELIDLWKESWSKQGFDPIVLSMDDAKKHPYYEEFITKLKHTHIEITGKPISDYGLSCYLRWLAYANQNEKNFFLMSDYDVINKNFIYDDLDEIIQQNNMSFLDRYCPCLAYGNSETCFQFCRDIVECSQSFKDDITQEYKNNQCVWYHDQEFLALNHNRLSNYKIFNNYVKLYAYGIQNGRAQLGTKLFHVAHRSISEAKLQHIKLMNIDDDKLRINFIKKILNNTTCQLTLGLDIPSCFDAEKYEALYPECKGYFTEKTEKTQRLYHHYLQYGKQSNYAFNFKSLPVFYHIPKNGGVSLCNNVILSGLHFQYSILTNNNYIYDISILQNNSKLLKVYAIPIINQLYSTNMLKTIELINNPDNTNKKLVYAQIQYSPENIDELTNNFEILAIVIESNGFKNSDEYIGLFGPDKIINKIIVLRQPINHVQSLFYYLRDVGHWEQTSKYHQNMSFMEYAYSNLIPNNWIVRNLTNLQDDQPVTEDHLESCKNYLSKFNHIGFLEKIEDTLKFLDQEYNWKYINNIKENENKVSKKEPITSELLDQLNCILYYDNKLYDYFYKQRYNNT